MTWSGCIITQKAMISLAILNAIDALVNNDPAQANEPHKYAKILEYFFGDKTLVHTYCPPADGIAEDISDNVIPIQYEINAIIIIPYTINIGPPDCIPVTKDAEIPNHELVNPNPIPKIDQTEKVLFNSP